LNCADPVLTLLFGEHLRRLVNHSRKPNAVPNIICFDSVPHLCFTALWNIDAGEQVIFN